MAEGDGLENRCVSNGTKGSNPLPSAVHVVSRRSWQMSCEIVDKLRVFDFNSQRPFVASLQNASEHFSQFRAMQSRFHNSYW